MASLSTIEKILKIHNSRKQDLDIQKNTSYLFNNTLTSDNTEKMNESSYYEIDRGVKFQSEYDVLNSDVIKFSRNTKTLSQILNKTVVFDKFVSNIVLKRNMKPIKIQPLEYKIDSTKRTQSVTQKINLKLPVIYKNMENCVAYPNFDKERNNIMGMGKKRKRANTISLYERKYINYLKTLKVIHDANIET